MKKTTLFAILLVCFSSLTKAQDMKTSKVVFLRTFNVIGSIIGYNVFHDTTQVSRLKPQTLKVVDLEAKPTRLWAETEVKRYIDIDLRPNSIYFVRGKVGMGFFVVRPRLETLNIQEFKDLVARKKYLQKQIKRLGFDNVDDFIKPYQTVQFTSL